MRRILNDYKRRGMAATAARREALKREPVLRQLFLELTLRCNERCLHCGSSCGAQPCPEVSLEDYRRLLDGVKRDFDISRMMLCITGGEPMLRPDFFDIVGYAHELGFRWGMTSNATLIDAAAAKRLRESGMRTISVSIDGLPETHDRLRRSPGSFRRAMAGVQALIDEGGFKAIQITTVVNHGNLSELEALYERFLDVDIDSWRVVAIEPIGRALEHPELQLTGAEHRALLDFIRHKREQQMPVTYGCCHYLGLEYEREVRDWFFFCGAGRTVASVMTNGDIGACLNIDRNPRTIQGTIYRDDFSDVWRNRFQTFRGSLAEGNAACRSCPHVAFCDGDSCHSWDYAADAPLACLRGQVFD